MSNLDSFIKSSRPSPLAVGTSQEIHDRDSVFVATIYRATSVAEARKCVKHLKHVTHALNPASHEITAWRSMMLKHGKTGLSGEDDFELNSGCEDDGENWAGGKVLKVRFLECALDCKECSCRIQVMQTEGIIDAVVIVSRW